MINKFRINSLADFENLRCIWDDALNGCDNYTVFQTFEWNKLLVKEALNNREYNRNCFVAVYSSIDDNEGTILIPVIIRTRAEKVSLFKKSVGINLLGFDSYSDYLDIIGVPEGGQLGELIYFIRQDYPELPLYFTDVQEGCPLDLFLQKNAKVIKTNNSVQIRKQETYEQYKQSLSKSTRQNLRTSLNRIEKANYNYHFDILKGPINNKKLLEQLRDLHIKRTKEKIINRSSIRHFVSSNIRFFIRKRKELNNNIIYHAMSECENSVTVIAYIDDSVAGYLYGLIENNTIRIMQNCYDSRFAFYSPMFRCAFDFIKLQYEDDTVFTPPISTIDFTRGDEDYKIKLGGTIQHLYSYLIN